MDFSITAPLFIGVMCGVWLAVFIWNEWKAREERKRVMRKRSEYRYPDCVRYR